ncbi:PREDICTED: putative methyltransferase DDB_G0268948 isoform X2 [Ipomoea nil]|uniref:putative methyltransferase DDB_G0268948 isoform X2 n=1 Tax=Ipomoea nil TaxID=35883 RepID=UPI0009017FC0|nr:PREDICTED: putative methyltransferase DDB_G0268948 isoform X2 [Ipomoea nil]
MADLFLKQGKQYSEGRPTYPQQLFDFIASKTPRHDLVWDVGTGTGQAAMSLGEKYKNVVGTDTSPNQLQFAPNLPNVRFVCTPPNMTLAELEANVGAESSVDLVTIAQALHWFHLPTFYQQVKWVLKKPDGVIAAWCYDFPEVSSSVDSIYQRYYTTNQHFWEPGRKLVDQKYRTIDFPFDPVDGCEHNGPYEFKAQKLMELESYFAYIRSSSGYQTAKNKGVEILSSDLVQDFTRAWNEDGKTQKIVAFPIYLRIGKVGILD